MKAIIEETIIGIIAYDEKGTVISESLYPNDPKQIALAIRRQRQGEITHQVADLIENLKEAGVDALVMVNQQLLVTLATKYNLSIEHVSSLHRKISKDISEFALKNGFISSPEEFSEFLHEVNTQIAQVDLHEALSERESLLIPTVQLLSDMDTILNSLSGRMREWYGVHFPELSHRVKEHQDYARIIQSFGDRDNITVKALYELSFKKRDAERIENTAKTSVGASMDTNDIKAIQAFTQQVTELYKERGALTDYLTSITEEIAPNIAYLAGPILGAKLIEKAGGLKRMAMMPASAIQVLGAEKAMFRALTTNAKPPKHGLLFQHPYVHSAQRNKRGSRARSLAAKIAIAARADVFSGDFIAEDLKKRLEKD